MCLKKDKQIQEVDKKRKTYTPLEEVDCPSVFLGSALPHHVGSTS